jgi:hypothetical protein
MGYRLNSQNLTPSRARNFSLIPIVQTNFANHPSFYSMGTGTPSPEVK